MTIYYRDGEVRVTDHAIEVRSRAFPTAELTYVWHERGRPTLQTTSRGLARLGLIAVFTVPAVAGAIVAARLIAGEQGAAAQVGLALILAALAAVVVVLLAPVLEFPMMALERSYDRGTKVHEIWVRWHNQDLMLLRTTDAARFGRIYRAIQRAVERDDL